MKHSVALIAVIALTGCGASTNAISLPGGEAKRLATQEDMGAIIGRTLTHRPGQSFVISADGTLAGSWDDAPVVGTYEMKDGFFCRTLSEGPNGPSPEDCQLLELTGNQLKGTRSRGTSTTFTYTVS